MSSIAGALAGIAANYAKKKLGDSKDGGGGGLFGKGGALEGGVVGAIGRKYKKKSSPKNGDSKGGGDNYGGMV